MAEAAAVAGVAGLGLQLFGMNEEAKARKSANRKNAAIRRAQIKDLEERFDINSLAIRREGQKVINMQTGSFAKGGVKLGTGSTLIAMESTRQAVNEQIKNERFELRRRVNNLGTEAAMLDAQNASINRANTIGLMATTLTGTANLLRAS